MDIFAHKDLAAFLGWCAKSPDNPTYLAEQGIDHAKSVETMRLLTLCSLAVKEKELSYEAITAALQVRAACGRGRVLRARFDRTPASPASKARETERKSDRE